jgi:hypothetical protein
MRGLHHGDRCGDRRSCLRAAAMTTVVASPFLVARRGAFARARACKPRPGEPSGVGAVVQAGNGDLYTRPKVTTTSRHWQNAYGMNDGTRYRWDELPLPITVLSPGVEVTL